MRFLPPLLIALLLASLLASASHPAVLRVSLPSHAVRSEGCQRFASPTGSDRDGRGTRRRPYGTLTRLDRSLRPGQTGCLLGGTYGGLRVRHRINTSGTAAKRITIRASPGARATVVGWIEIEASYTTIEDLRIDGSNTLYPQHPMGVSCRAHVSQPLVIAGHNDILQHVDYFQSVADLRGNAIGVGFWGDADDTIIRHNWIHDVGGCEFYDHLIYLASGSSAQIYDNWMWNDPHGWGVKLDPGPRKARIWGNVIDGAGSGFSFGNSSGAMPTSDNLVFDNVVLNSTGTSNPQIHWSYSGVLVTSPGLLASAMGNQVYGNDSYNNPGGLTDIARGVSSRQLTVTGNRTGAPHFVDPAGHNYLLSSGRRLGRH